eukprot:NODE_873_length_3373_cov_0.775199.p2 type:complete len:210 gc:universal NODE_873_length_3373_cov_0.775199:2614-1985(-)
MIPICKMPKVYVIYHSIHGHLAQMAKAVKTGLERKGVTVVMGQVAESLPQEVLEKMHAAPKDKSIPVLEPTDIKDADGIIFGVPTRYGNATAQWRQWWDKSGGIWQKQAWRHIPAGVFVGTATAHGGQESTVLTFITQLIHHGMPYVPIGYGHPLLGQTEEVIGGGPYGAGNVSGGDGSRGVLPKELEIAEWQGEQFADFVNRIGPKKA